MAARDLISREAAVREALRIYRDARETVRKCQEAEDDFGTLAFEGQMEAFRWMVMVLMALPAAGKDEADKEQNEPLTIEQLREMGGQPYWHVGLRKESVPPHWNILDPFYAKHIEIGRAHV